MSDIASMRAVGLGTPFVWLDVEPVPIFEWSETCPGASREMFRWFAQY